MPALRVTTGATAMQMIVVTNTGDTGQDLSITAATISGTGAGDYTILSEPSYPATIAPSTGSAMYLIRFDPSTAGMIPARQASLLARPGLTRWPVSTPAACRPPMRVSRGMVTTTVAATPPVFGSRSTG